MWGSERRIYAALKFFLFTFVGSVLMLLAIFWLWSNSGAPGHRTFDYVELMAQGTAHARGAEVALPRFRARLRHQGAHLAAAHLAARAQHRSARRGIDHPRRA